MARALAMVDYPVVHVYDALPEYRTPTAGQSPAPDEDVARWCGSTEHVLVTIDTGFKSRWVRTGLLNRYGVEVVVFDRDLIGLRDQHATITRHFDGWERTLGRHPYVHRVWLQDKRVEPHPVAGHLVKKRSATPRPRVAEPQTSSSPTS